jgi:glucose/arabinose dehydrogenase
LFVAERSGAVRVVAGGEVREEPFLDLRDRVTAMGIEQGLLGLAFHPTAARVFAYFVDAAGRRTLAEYAHDGERADPATERRIFSLAQPPGSVDIRHYGGMLAFAPDGRLHVASGDGADARGQGQDPTTPFGAILAVDTASGEWEVWAYGLRNPWRFAVDAEEALMYIADVGQETWEEINVMALWEAGVNFGWPDTEGAACFLRRDCDLASYRLPVYAYGHDEGCSVTGGVVYRGSSIPELRGHYFFSDWCSGWVRSFRLDNGAAADEADWGLAAGSVNTFGVDHEGEVYLANYQGELYRLVPLR